QRLGSLYAAVGWIFFYGITAVLFWKLRFYCFTQTPLVELTASGAFILLLLSLRYLHHALRLERKSPLAFIFDAAAGVIVLGLAGFSLLLWAAASRDFALAGRLERAYHWIPLLSHSAPAPPAAKLLPSPPPAHTAWGHPPQR